MFFYVLNKHYFCILVILVSVLSLLCLFIFFKSSYSLHQILSCLGKVAFSEVILFISLAVREQMGLFVSYACNLIARWTISHSVLCCIYSAPLGGELSGFCFVLHSLKGTAACRRLMVRVGLNVKPITTSLHSPFTVSSFII